MQSETPERNPQEAEIVTALADGLPDSWQEAVLDVTATAESGGVESYRFVIKGLSGRLAPAPSQDLMAAVRNHSVLAQGAGRPWKRLVVTMVRGPHGSWDYYCEETS